MDLIFKVILVFSFFKLLVQNIERGFSFCHMLYIVVSNLFDLSL